MAAVDANFCVPVNTTVGCGPAGFGGLTFNGAVLRWIQASSAPDLMLPELIKAFMPFFFIFMAVEAAWAHFAGVKTYSLRLGWTNVAAAATNFLIAGIFIRGLTIFPYMTVHNLWGIVKSKGLLVHLTAFVGIDLAYYWGHRFEHFTNLGWGSHIVHHTPPTYNLLSGFRQGSEQMLINWIFFTPLALIVPLDVFYTHYGVMFIWQYFMHTEFVYKMHPIIEYICMTPSHHRVHHARNYPRANYGAMLIIWDRVFGTCIEEREDRPCIYGLDERKTPMGTHNPAVQELQHWYFTFKGALEAPGFDKLKVLFTRKHVDGMISSFITDGDDDNVAVSPDGIPYDHRVSKIDLYMAVQGLLLFPVAFGVYYYAGDLPPLHTVVWCLNLLLSLYTLLTLLDEPEGMGACHNEILRWIIFAPSGIWLLDDQYALSIIMLAIASSLSVYYITVSSKSHKE